jgi:hypothetical protein
MDYVAGNPPWVNWESLPPEYRDALKPIWEQYGLFTLSGSAGRLGGGKKDISMLFVYGASDNYLRDLGRLGFVITQSVFKTKGAGDGFRQFGFERDKKRVVLRPLLVHDLSQIQVFEGATNRTAVFVCEKRYGDFSYPVPYFTWTGPSRIAQDAPLREVLTITSRQEMGALPVDKGKPSSQWLTAPRSALGGMQKVIGKSFYQAYAGCCTWLNGVYFLRVVKDLPGGKLLVENLSDIGKIEVRRVEAAIEKDLVYPLLRGRDVSRWRAHPSAFILLTQDSQTRTGISDHKMKRDYPKTYDYLKLFESDLRKRSGYRQYFKPTDPFWSIYNVGPYSMAPWKVYWTRVARTINAAVAGVSGSEKTILSVETATFVPFDGPAEAHYFAALLNSSPCRIVIDSYSSKSTGSFGSPHVLTNVAIPEFRNGRDDCMRLSQFSEQCHNATRIGDMSQVAAVEAEIDSLAAKLWGLTDDELKAIQGALAETSKSKRAKNESADSADDLD